MKSESFDMVIVAPTYWIPRFRGARGCAIPRGTVLRFRRIGPITYVKYNGEDHIVPSSDRLNSHLMRPLTPIEVLASALDGV